MILGLARSWSLAGYAVAALLVLPLFALIFQAFQPDEAVFDHLMATVLPTYIINSLLLIFG